VADPDPSDWAFDSQTIDLDGDMTLVLARRKGSNLVGWKIEFADDATGELRSMLKRTASMIDSFARRGYEPSLRIGDGEYLAVPDQLVERAAAVPPPANVDAEGVSETTSAAATATAVHIETDPQVRHLLRNASGLGLITAQGLSKQPFLFYAVVVGSSPTNRTAFVRKLNPTKSLDAGKHWFSMGERLSKVDQPLLSLDDHFDLVVTDDGIAVLHQGVFDLLFRDAQTLVDRYPLWASAFSSVGLDGDQTASLVSRCQRDSRLATRLRQIYESGHLSAGKVKLDQVLAEADRVAGGRDRFLKDGKLNFDCADIAMLLKLLNDDLFVGGLSKVPYEAGSKARRA
jgi:hypothetical protein